VVFSSDREGNYQIFKMPLNGGGVTRLTENNATEGAPRWSPDGKKIAFISDRDGPCRVFIMDGNGGNAAAIPNTDPTPGDVNAGVPLDWSPDGNSLVFVNKDHTAIRVVNADGSGLRTIVEGKIGKGYGYYHGVCWRQPNKIVFNVQNPSWGYDQDVFAVAPRDGQLTQITDEWGQYGHCMAPDLSPDGNSIVILRQPEKDPPPRSIFVMTAEGRDLRNLTRTAQMDAAPRWSPDGNRIVFCSGTMGKKHIWLMNADGSEQLQLTKGDSDDIQPDIR
jgi:TolB protein